MAVKTQYCEFQPSVLLQNHIKAYWYFSVTTTTNSPFYILPDGYFDLLIVIKNNTIVNCKLTGIWNKLVIADYSENTEVIGIRFKPVSIGSIFKFNISQYLNHSESISLNDFNINGDILLEAVLSNNLEELVNYLNNYFLKIVCNEDINYRLIKCFNAIEETKGCITMNNVSDLVGLSARHIYRLTTDMMGIGLKDYAKIIRFKKTLHDIKIDKTNYLYYFDQSHFIRDAKLFTGLTPKEMDLNGDVRFVQFYNYE